MDTGMANAYWQAAQKSYANQEGGITIPSAELNNIVEIALGFQPLGISSRHIGDADEIAIAAYFEPAICLATITHNESGLNFAVSWIRGATHGVERVRLFPDIAQPSGANRLQTVNFCPDGKLWASRNGERIFYGYSPSGNGWTLTEKVRVPEQSGGYYIIHSALLRGDRLHTIESSPELTVWLKEEYVLNAGLRPIIATQPVPDYTYGIGQRSRDEGAVWTVTDFRATIPLGVYRDNQMLVRGVSGTGICFLQDGSALVTRYGQSHPGAFNGISGALIYIPSTLFNV